jgi:hypothetical protein
MGWPALPEPCGDRTPSQVVPLRSRTESPGLKVTVSTRARLRQAVSAEVPVAASFPAEQST